MQAQNGPGKNFKSCLIVIIYVFILDLDGDAALALMKAIQVKAPGGDFELVQKEIPEPKTHEALLKVEACGVCHGDAIVKQGYFPGLQYPRTPGHEVVGTIVKLGSESHFWKIGQRVGVGWRGGSCLKCRSCLKGDFWSCESPLATGISTDGGYAEYMVARMDVLTAIPAELSSIEAAPLLCAGATTLGALKSSSAKGGDLIAIHGLGGLGHLALQFAVRLGFRVAVISRGKEKEELARRLGAQIYLDSTATNAAEELMKLGGARAIFCTAPNSQAISELVGGLARGGQMIIITFVDEPLQISPAQLMRGVRSVGGWVGGNATDTMNFSVLTHVVPMVETFPLEKAAIAFERMMTAKVHFRAVLKIA
jgi:2-desacetyl-2-hydroxyethyl bacteriochlorophyllide A dehydrogenase